VQIMIEWPSEDVRSVASEIAVLRDIDGGHLPPTVEEFWHQLALSSGVLPSHDLMSTAKATAGALGFEFDDDYLDQESGLPALSFYEVVLSTIQNAEARRSGAEGTADDADDDGDDTNVDLSTYIADVPPRDWTVRETLLRIGEGSLVLNPEWQRGFVWKLQKQRRLIESMLLGLPIPSFLFFEESSTGRIYVIDGRQRLETIQRFMAPKEKKGEMKVRFRTFGPKIAGWSTGQPLNQAANRYYDQLPDSFKTKFERAPLVTFTFKDIPPEQLYQIFKRYNTGAVALNAAEIRNAVYQASELHGMMFRLGGEHRDKKKYRDGEEQEVGEALRATMPKGKLERYGAYDFIGRYFAFRYERTGSVSAATNTFMQKYGKDGSRVDMFRREFIRAFNKTIEWYQYALIEPIVDGSFHAMLATIQLVSTTVALSAIDGGTLKESVVQERIAAEWPEFAGKVLEEKQNSTLFWNSQQNWNTQLTRTQS
jgi:hypothetical protein